MAIQEPTLHLFDGEYPGNPGQEFMMPAIADVTKTYPQLQPEADQALIATYRTGQIVHIYQDLNSMAYNNTYPYVTYPPGSQPPQRQSMSDVYQNIINSPTIPGTF